MIDLFSSVDRMQATAATACDACSRVEACGARCGMQID